MIGTAVVGTPVGAALVGTAVVGTLVGAALVGTERRAFVAVE